MSDPDIDGIVYRLKRPHEDLLKYYVLRSFLLGPFFFVLLIPSYLRFRTLLYRFDDEGVSVRWGILFRREISLTYSRIQDIHLASNAVERFLGLARVQIQTASGSSTAEITVEGLKEFDLVRDFLYSRMRGARRKDLPSGTPQTSQEPETADDLARTLNAIADEIAGLRADLERSRASKDES